MNRLSVVVPIYNVERYLPDCVASILSQTHRDLELILVDDGSVDDSLAICESVAVQDGRVKVLPLENGGVSRARNAGLDSATGSYVAFIDSDDWLDPDAFSQLLAHAADGTTDIVGGDLVNERQSGRKDVEVSRLSGGFFDRARIEREIFPLLLTSPRLEREWPFRSVTKIYRREFLSANAIRFPEGMHAAQDFVFSVATMLVADSFYYVRGMYAYHYREHQASRTHRHLAEPWVNYSDLAAQVCRLTADDPQFKDQLKLSCLHGDLSALSYTYRFPLSVGFWACYHQTRCWLANRHDERSFFGLDWKGMSPRKRIICGLLRRRQYFAIHIIMWGQMLGRRMSRFRVLAARS